MSEQRAALVRMVTLASAMSKLWGVTLEEAMRRTVQLTYAAAGKPLTDDGVQAVVNFMGQVERVAGTMGLPLADAAGLIADVADGAKAQASTGPVVPISGKVH